MNSNKKDKENTQFIEFFDELLEFFEEFDGLKVIHPKYLAMPDILFVFRWVPYYLSLKKTMEKYDIWEPEDERRIERLRNALKELEDYEIFLIRHEGVLRVGREIREARRSRQHKEEVG